MDICLDNYPLTRSEPINQNSFSELRQENRRNLSFEWEIFIWNSKGRLEGKKEDAALKGKYIIPQLTDYSDKSSLYNRKSPSIDFSSHGIKHPEHQISLIGGWEREILIHREEAEILIDFLENSGLICLLHNPFSKKIFPLEYHCHQEIKQEHEIHLAKKKLTPIKFSTHSIKLNSTPEEMKNQARGYLEYLKRNPESKIIFRN